MSSIQLVVKQDACVGCGFCAAHRPDVFAIEETPLGTYEASIRDAQAVVEDESIGRNVCPFAEGNPDEDELAAAYYAHLDGAAHASETGYYLKLYAGAVCDQETRLRSSSGGIISWTARTLLELGEVDVVACVGPTFGGESLFGYRLVRDPDELAQCRKSRYYPIHVVDVIRELRETNERVAFIGLPCFIKALRLFLDAEPQLKDRVRYTIGLFCGHLKSKRYATYLSRTCGVSEDSVQQVDFRKKLEGRPASDYAFEVQHVLNDQAARAQVAMKDVFGGRWGTNLFMVGACNWCDDVMAETADMAVGDAWIKPYSDDYRGHSVVIARHPDLVALLEQGQARGALELEALTEKDVIRSQAGGLRQRRVGLSYRLDLADRKQRWHPPKRVKPNAKAGGRLFQLVVRLRERARRTSHAAMLLQGSRPGLRSFRRRMWLWVTLLEWLYVLRSRLARFKG